MIDRIVIKWKEENLSKTFFWTNKNIYTLVFEYAFYLTSYLIIFQEEKIWPSFHPRHYDANGTTSPSD